MKKTLFLFLAIILLGSFLRIYNISNKELWYDEAFSAEIIKNPYIELFKLSTLDVHPPLYYYTLKVFTEIFGNSETSLRFPSVIFGIALIILVYYLVLYITKNTNRALFASLIIATNPFLVIYSREARSYSMVAFLTVLVFFLLLKALKTKKYIPIAIFMPLLFLTHYISVFIIFIYTIILFIHNKKTLIYLVPLFFLILIWISIIIEGSKSTGLEWVPQFTLIRIPESIHAFLLGTDTNKPSVAPPLNPFPIEDLTLSIIIFIFISIFIALSKPSNESKILFICAIIPIILVAITSKYLGFNFYVERFMTGYGALLLIYLVISIKRLYLLLPYVLLCIYLVLNLKPINIGYRELAKYKFDKPIVMTSASDYITAKYYVKNIKLHNGDWEQWVIIHPEDIYNKEGMDRNFYLVNKGPLDKWEPTMKLGGFYFYDWDVEQEILP